MGFAYAIVVTKGRHARSNFHAAQTVVSTTLSPPVVAAAMAVAALATTVVSTASGAVT